MKSLILQIHVIRFTYLRENSKCSVENKLNRGKNRSRYLVESHTNNQGASVRGIAVEMKSQVKYNLGD